MKFEGKAYDQVAVGDTFTESLTVTETHITLGARLIGDFNPLHVNAEFARQSRFGARILHGVMTAAIAGAPVGNYFAGKAIAYLEQNNRFTAPVYAGDTLTSTWTVTETIDKPRSGGGIVKMKAACANQNGVVVLEATGTMLVGNT
jgi:acyl dehydratase